MLMLIFAVQALPKMQDVWDEIRNGGWVDIPPFIEVTHDIVPRKSLKELEGFMGMSVMETTIPFDIARPPEQHAESHGHSEIFKYLDTSSKYLTLLGLSSPSWLLSGWMEFARRSPRLQ